MKRLVICLMVLAVFTITAYADMGGQQECGPGMMGGGQQMPMMCPMMQQMHGQGMQGGQQMMGGEMMGGMMGMRGERMGRHHPWFQHGVSLILRNSMRLGLNDQQKAKLNDIRIKYTKDIIRQDAELKIAEIDLDSLLKESEINLQKVKEALKKTEGMETQIRYLRIEALTEARKILTEEQRENLRKMMEERSPMMMRGMMGAYETESEEQEEAGKEITPKTDPHGH